MICTYFDFEHKLIELMKEYMLTDPGYNPTYLIATFLERILAVLSFEGFSKELKKEAIINCMNTALAYIEYKDNQ